MLLVETGILVGIVFGAIVFLLVFISVLVDKNKKKYINFVFTHSEAIQKLDQINKEYCYFKNIPSFDMKNTYDNENFYDDISCFDYLTYQLVYLKGKVNKAIDDTLDNEIMFVKYKDEVKDIKTFHQYDVPTEKLKIRKLNKYEDKMFKERAQKPVTHFSIKVELTLTKINGAFRHRKRDEFSISEIKDVIRRINNKSGDFYRDENIWKSICRVERGKVSNKMRFSIYERDHYRCQMCGRRTNDLEIDHIIPIAKGGKSTYDNLQTLCHRCNKKKGSDIYY